MHVTTTRYQECLSKVLNYLQENLDSALSLDELASVACLSSYHFHRIFSAYTGESLYGHIRRLRLELAAKQLKYGKAPVGRIGLDSGFETHASFTKAFRHQFDSSPLEFRRIRQAEMRAEAEMASGDGQVKPEFRTLAPMNICYVRRNGSYQQAAADAWQALMQYACRHGLLHENALSLGITYDDPLITREGHIRYEACLNLQAPRKPDGEVGVKEIKGGRYAVFRHTGPYQNLWATYKAIYCDWLFTHEISLRHSPEFSIYLNHHSCKEDQSDLVMEIFVPVEGAGNYGTSAGAYT